MIDRAHVTRQSRAAGGAQTLLPSAGDIEKVPPRVDEQGNVVGLSGLTEMMQREARPRAGGQANRPPEAAAVRRSSVAAARTQRRRKDVRWLYLLLGLMVAIMVLLGVSIWFATNVSTGRYSDHLPSARNLSRPGPDQPASAPVLTGSLLTIEPWQEQRTMFMLPVHPPAYARALRVIEQPGGGVMLAGEVLSTSRGVVTGAEARVALVDGQDMTVALAAVPLTLISRNHAQPLVIDLPADMPREGVRPEVTVAVDRALPDARLIPNLPAVSTGEGRATRVGVRWTNSDAQAAEQLLLLVTALDDQDLPIRRWTARWPRAVEPGETISFSIATPIEHDLSVARWTVDAAAP